MKSVGIKVLKDNLSRYLKLVRAGETIWVTDRDEIIAEIHRPTRPIIGHIHPWEAFLNSEERSGSVQRAKMGSGPSIEILRQLPRPRDKIDLQRLLDETRAD